MIGLLVLIYFIGRQFFFLARDYQHNPLLFAILGVDAYYLGTLLFDKIISALSDYSEFCLYLASTTPFIRGLAALPTGLLCCWIFFHILRAQWQRKLRIQS